MPQMRLVMKCASRGSLPFMKMLYPRKIDDVLWHSTTFFCLKSILVYMPRLPTIRVIGSQAISTRPVSSAVVMALPISLPGGAGHRPRGHQVFLKPVRSSSPLLRHFGSSSAVFEVKPRRVRITVPYIVLAVVETFDPGGSSMNGMNLSGKPGMVQAMQMPPTFGQPPTPLIQPRLGTLHLTTGPQQPSLTRHLGEPYSPAKSPCS